MIRTVSILLKFSANYYKTRDYQHFEKASFTAEYCNRGITLSPPHFDEVLYDPNHRNVQHTETEYHRDVKFQLSSLKTKYSVAETIEFEKGQKNLRRISRPPRP